MALIILLASFFLFPAPKLQAQENNSLQLQLGDSASVYSEKAYRKDGGNLFEAVGNVIILSGKDTLYGEKASFNIQEGVVKVEGNARFIGQNITLYGSKIEFNSVSGELSMENSRVVTNDFNIVAENLVRKGPDLYHAEQAEFTTCKDCEESWSLFGEKIIIELNQYVRVYNAMIKVKGAHILYIPFIALPIKTQRESGLLFPEIQSRVEEGVSYQQPFYWAIDDSKDFTLTPSFWGLRGYGADWQYRQVFAQDNWLEYNHRVLEDKIYLPGKASRSLSGKGFGRHFYELEAHQQWSNSLTQHVVATGARDLDMFRDFTDFTDRYLTESSIGFSGFLEKRFMAYNLGVRADYRRNLLATDATAFDKSYVQTLPSLYFNIMPHTVYQSDKLFLQNISVGLDSDYTVFKQREEDESLYLRNAARLQANPYIHWQFFNYGPASFSSNFTQYASHYRFEADDEKYFQKTAGFLRSEFSFSMDKIFGLAYEERISVKEVDQEAFSLGGGEREAPRGKESDLVGHIPDFEESLTEETITVVKNSYRHSQDFKFIHHKILNSSEKGNERFLAQIERPQGWFDYDDAILESQASLGSNLTRTIIPRQDTLEFQWNNLLIRKSPKTFNYFEDQRYLRDNFNYSRVGFFNLSQGFLLGEEEGSFNDKLTRLYAHTGYNAQTWSLDFKEYYFHQNSDQISQLRFTKKFKRFNTLLAYSANSLPGSTLKTLKLGGVARVADSLGVSAVTEYDLDAEENIRTVYQADFMPYNDCWILSFNYRQSVVDERYSVNFLFNLGNEEFKAYRRDYLSLGRIN